MKERSKAAVVAAVLSAMTFCSALPMSAAADTSVAETVQTSEVSVSDYSWIKDDSGRIYCKNEEDKVLKGVQEIDGEKYLFADNGVLKTGWRTIDGRRYYFDKDTGKPVYGWIEYGGNKYLVLKDTAKCSGIYINDEGKGYCLDKETGALITKKGVIKSGDNYYYVNPDGTLASGAVSIDGISYIFDKTAYFMFTGWHTLNGKTFYYSPEDGKAKLGLFELEGKWYYCDKTKGVNKGEFYMSGLPYRADNNGVIQTGWQSIGGIKRYYYPDTLKIAKGICEIGGKKYIFSDDGEMYTGRRLYNGNKYYLGTDGVMRTGKIKLDDGTYYFDSEGKMAFGWQKIGDDKYFFDDDGKMMTGRLLIGNYKYYIDETGKVCTGIVKLDDGTYFFDSEGRMDYGKQIVDGKAYYFDKKSGRMMKNYSMDGYRYGSDGVGKPLSDVQKRADVLLATINKTADSIYSYVLNNNKYGAIEEPLTLNAITNKGWGYFADYAMDHKQIMYYHFAALTDLLFQQANMESRIVYGTGRRDGEHFWNQVKVNGVWRNYDACNNYKNVTDEYLIGEGYTIAGYIYPDFS